MAWLHGQYDTKLAHFIPLPCCIHSMHVQLGKAKTTIGVVLNNVTKWTFQGGLNNHESITVVEGPYVLFPLLVQTMIIYLMLDTFLFLY